MSAEFLLEIGVEEIPARFLARGIEDLVRAATTFFEGMGLSGISVESAYTPRRLTVWASGIPLMTPRVNRNVFGPPKEVAMNASGTFTPAAEGFAKRAGRAVTDLRWFVDGKGREVLGYVEELGGESAAERLAEAIPGWIADIKFDKTMRWESTAFRFARPIRWIVAMLGEGVIPVSVADVESGKTTVGHRFFGKAFEVLSVQGYRDGLRAGYVILDPAERRSRIVEGISEAAGKQNLSASQEDVESVLDEVTNLVEWPKVLIGSFDPAILELPEPVVLAPLRGHQRYISLRAADGQLANQYAIVSNYPGTEDHNVVSGNDRVLRARLSDARFFFESDLRKPLAEMAKGLADVLFHRDLGTYADKTQRVARLAETLAKAVRPSVAADIRTLTDASALSRADLLSSMVGEFPELQGVMGGEYARRQGLPGGVATAIEDFYLPAGGAFDSPRTLEGRLLALADRLDTLAGYFSIGQVPSGAKDPFALRRAARGAALICEALSTDQGVWLDLHDVLTVAVEAQPHKGKKPPSGPIVASIGEFIAQRTESIGVERYADVGTLFFRAASAARPFAPAATMALARSAAKAAAEKPREWEQLLDAGKRIRNITRGADGTDMEPSIERMHPAAQALWKETSSKLGGTGQEPGQSIGQTIENLYSLTPVINNFFEQVLVNDADPEIKRNNVAMLVGVRRLLGNVLNFDVIVG